MTNSSFSYTFVYKSLQAAFYLAYTRITMYDEEMRKML